jgi:hypothetical protein
VICGNWADGIVDSLWHKTRSSGGRDIIWFEWKFPKLLASLLTQHQHRSLSYSCRVTPSQTFLWSDPKERDNCLLISHK